MRESFAIAPLNVLNRMPDEASISDATFPLPILASSAKRGIRSLIRRTLMRMLSASAITSEMAGVSESMKLSSGEGDENRISRSPFVRVALVPSAFPDASDRSTGEPGLSVMPGRRQYRLLTPAVTSIPPEAIS